MNASATNLLSSLTGRTGGAPSLPIPPGPHIRRAAGPLRSTVLPSTRARGAGPLTTCAVLVLLALGGCALPNVTTLVIAIGTRVEVRDPNAAAVSDGWRVRVERGAPAPEPTLDELEDALRSFDTRRPETSK